MLHLYDFLPSGNCYKIRLLLHQLGISYQRIDINILKGESRTPEFLAKNRNGRVPLLATEDGRFIAESNAILFYLSQDTEFWPRNSWQQTQVLQWLFFEQYSHEPYIATSRYWISILGKADEYREAIAQKRQPGYAALEVMENHLKQHQFFVAERYTIADIGLFAYTHVAEEGGFDLTEFPAVRAWLERVQAQPGHIGIKKNSKP